MRFDVSRMVRRYDDVNIDGILHNHIHSCLCNVPSHGCICCRAHVMCVRCLEPKKAIAELKRERATGRRNQLLNTVDARKNSIPRIKMWGKAIDIYSWMLDQIMNLCVAIARLRYSNFDRIERSNVARIWVLILHIHCFHLVYTLGKYK